PLLKTQAAALTVDLGKESSADLRLVFPAEADAREAEKAVQATLSAARLGLGLAAQQVRKDPKAAKLTELLGRAQADLEDTTVKQEGARIDVAVRVKADVLEAS